MHPADEVVTKYNALLRERDECDRKIDQVKAFMARRDEIEKELAELRPKLAEAAANS